jgi:hypothetical protein
MTRGPARLLLGRPHPPRTRRDRRRAARARPVARHRARLRALVLATGALVLLGDRSSTAGPGPSAAGRHRVRLPVAAQLVCAPVILLLTPAVSLYAVPANVLAAPAVAPATVLGLAAGCVRRGGSPAPGAGARRRSGVLVDRCRRAHRGSRARARRSPGCRRDGSAVLAVAGVCVLRPARGRSRGAGEAASVTSGRLCACLLPPDAPPPARARHGGVSWEAVELAPVPAGQRSEGPARGPCRRPGRLARPRRGPGVEVTRLDAADYSAGRSAWSAARPCSPRTRSWSSTGSSVPVRSSWTT